MKKHIKPFGVFLFLFAVAVALGVVSVLFPPDGLQLGKLVHIRFPSPERILKPERLEYADISHILRALEAEPVLPEDTLPGPSPGDYNARAEEPGYGHETSADDPVLEAEPTALRKTPEVMVAGKPVFPLEYPDNNSSVLDNFYAGLSAHANDSLRIRIIHYGDSQIENDRISSLLRARFQDNFGGSGIGLFPVVSQVPHSPCLSLDLKGNWLRRSAVRARQPGRVHNRFGLLMSYSELTAASGRGVTGSVTIGPPGTGCTVPFSFGELSLFFGYNKKPFVMVLSAAGEVIDTSFFPPSDSLIVKEWDLPENRYDYSLLFRGEGSPEIYSLSIDDAGGVAVDNVPMRGSSGLEFTSSDPALLGKMMEHLNVRLVILQFGVNVVPHIVDDYRYYEAGLLRQLNFLKSVSPGINGIVVGVSDISRRVAGGYYESYPNIELIRDAQRNAAFGAGFAFWDMYEVMGGRNSMPVWVASDPPLGQPDHIHFTYRGSDLVGEMMFNAIMRGYDEYLGKLNL